MTARGHHREITAAGIQHWLVTRISELVERPAEQISVNDFIDELDVCSADSVLLVTDLEQWLGRPLNVTDVWRHPTIAALSRCLAEED